MLYHITKVSANRKTGPIPVTTSSMDTCPDACPFKAGGCYANGGPLALHWRKVTEGQRGMDWATFLNGVKAFPRGQVWRMNQAGDLTPDNNDPTIIDHKALSQLVTANKGKKGFTYTHYELNASNLSAIAEANRKGFTVNVSANNVNQAVNVYRKHQLPTTTVLPVDAPNSQSIDGVKIVACPAEKSDKINCANCQLCAISDRDYVIGFRAHGTQKKKANVIATSGDD